MKITQAIQTATPKEKTLPCSLLVCICIAVAAIIGFIIGSKSVSPGGLVDVQFLRTESMIEYSMDYTERAKQEALARQALTLQINTDADDDTAITTDYTTNIYRYKDDFWPLGVGIIGALIIAVPVVLLFGLIDDLTGYGYYKNHMESLLVATFTLTIILSIYGSILITLLTHPPVTDVESPVFQDAAVAAEESLQFDLYRMEYENALLEQYIAALQANDLELADHYYDSGAEEVLARYI